MMNDLLIRPVQIGDIYELHRSCWPEQSLNQVTTRIEELLNPRISQMRWGATALFENCSIGYGQLSRWGNHVEICNLIVAEEWRGKGVGTALIEWLLQLSREKQFPVVEIGAAESNVRALALYRRLGFQPNRSVMLDVGYGPEPVIYLSLDLRLVQKAG